MHLLLSSALLCFRGVVTATVTIAIIITTTTIIVVIIIIIIINLVDTQTDSLCVRSFASG